MVEKICLLKMIDNKSDQFCSRAFYTCAINKHHRSKKQQVWRILKIVLCLHFVILALEHTNFMEQSPS